ncbi:MAG: hypothetical protein DCC73_00960 [Proteobacteria bacterium]|nr:MAG: hypothetical protein DCC73_00960 [Pseudomonadota bacterium]
MKILRSKTLTSVAALAGASALWIGNAGAQDRGGLLIEEITVTAQKREESLKDVSVAVTAFSSEQLNKLGFNQSSDIIAQVPGLAVSAVSGSPSIVLFNIRGVNQNDFADHHESPIAIYEDEAYVASMTAAGFPLFDLDRVETLKGPQGTVFGRNATGGLIHFITQKPSTEEINGYGRFTYGSYDQIEVEGAVNLPMGDKAAFRVAGLTQNADGYYKNLLGPDRHEQDVMAVRGQFLFQPSEDLRVILKGHYTENNNEKTGAYTQRPSAPTGEHGYGELIGPNDNPWGTCNGCDLLGYLRPSNDPLVNEYDFEGFLDRKIYGASANIVLDKGDFSIVSLTDYRKSEKDYAEEVDSSPNQLLNFATLANVETFSQELRVNGEAENLRWLAGVNYLKIKGDYGSKIWDSSTFGGIASLDGLSFDTYSFWEHDKTAWAVFGQVEYDLSSQLTAIAGVRYTKDKVSHTWNNTVALDPFGFFAFPGAVSQFSGKSKDDLIDFKALLEYRPDDQWMLYAGVTQGSKGAGFNGSFQPDFAATIPFDREQLRNYEIGAKGSLFNGAAFLTSALFYYDYKDYQAFVFSGLVQRVQNVDATVIGGEIELQAHPMKGLDLNFGVSFLFKAEAKNVLLPDGLFADQTLPIAPDVTLNALARYSWDVPFGVASVQVDGSYQDTVNYSIINHPSTVGDSYALVNARISLAGQDDTWEIAGFVRNLTDKRFQTFALDISSFGFTQTQWGRPRWWGAEINYRF